MAADTAEAPLRTGPATENGAAALAALAAGKPALVWRKLIADTETPVGAALKLMQPGRGDFLLESVEGGEVRPPIEIVAAHFGEQAGAIGAGFLASQSYPS